MSEDLRTKFLHELREHRRSITLWRSPLKMLGHFIVVVAQFVQSALKHYGHLVLMAGLLSALAVFAHQTPGAHTPYLLQAKEHAFFFVWWVGLGIASSVGLGSGLHTFVLYLGPHIAQVAMAATSCNTLDFATSGPLAYKCTLQPNAQPPSVWDIFLKVQMACFLWGVGTAIGELPPYFMSRAAAQAGEKLAELNELEGDAAQTETFMDRAKAMVLSGLQRYGFWAILACASIPNPLFDLAGLASGHFGVPFATFFGATVIGKAGIKAHGQTLFVIMVSSKQNLQRLIDTITWLTPSAYKAQIGTWLNNSAKATLDKFQHPADAAAAPQPNMMSSAWDLFLGSMLLFFFYSIVDSLVQQRLAEQDEAKLAEFDAKHASSKSAAQPKIASTPKSAKAPSTPKSTKSPAVPADKASPAAETKVRSRARTAKSPAPEPAAKKRVSKSPAPAAASTPRATRVRVPSTKLIEAVANSPRSAPRTPRARK